MVRIRHITDPELRRKVIELLAEWRGMPASMIPDWFELDDADYSDLLIELRHREAAEVDPDARDPRD